MPRRYFFCWYTAHCGHSCCVIVTDDENAYIGSRMEIVQKHELSYQEATNINLDGLKSKYPLDLPDNS